MATAPLLRALILAEGDYCCYYVRINTHADDNAARCVAGWLYTGRIESNAYQWPPEFLYFNDDDNYVANLPD